jgi:prepilin peptidase CpaA
MESTIPMLLLVAVAAIYDLRTGKIPNPLLLAGLVFGLCFTLLTRGADDLLMSLAGFGVGFVLVLPGYLLRYTGAGDLKLLATLGVFSGPGVILAVFATSVVAGALFVLLKIAWRVLGRVVFYSKQDAVMPSAQLIPVQFHHRPSRLRPILKARMPMAPFYALGCTVVILFQLIGTGG